MGPRCRRAGTHPARHRRVRRNRLADEPDAGFGRRSPARRIRLRHPCLKRERTRPAASRTRQRRQIRPCLSGNALLSLPARRTCPRTTRVAVSGSQPRSSRAIPRNESIPASKTSELKSLPRGQPGLSHRSEDGTPCSALRHSASNTEQALRALFHAGEEGRDIRHSHRRHHAFFQNPIFTVSDTWRASPRGPKRWS